MGPLFPTATDVAVVLPADGACAGEHGDLLRLLREERGELEVELGAPVRIVTRDPGTRDRLVVRADPTARGPSLRRIDEVTLVASGRDLAEATDALSLLRTMRRSGVDVVEAEPAANVGAASDRLLDEIATTFPGLRERGIDWEAISRRHGAAVDPADPVPGWQRWVAELGDAHTSVSTEPREAPVRLRARVEDGRLRVAEVVAGTAAAEAGVAIGDEVLGVDVAEVARRTGASAHLSPWLVGYRALRGTPGEPTTLRIRRRDGEIVEVAERAGEVWPDHLQVRTLPSGAGYLRLRGWSTDEEDVLDDLLGRLAAQGRLVVDLRGNVGGSLVAATSFRARFVTREVVAGTIRYSVGDGSLSPATPIRVAPSELVRWAGRVRFLTDAMTYSASEDAILGLSQLDGVEVVGQPSGGGSGRPRTVRLLTGVTLSVSTALTYDHDGRLVEGQGVAVDRPSAALGEAAVAAADTGW